MYFVTARTIQARLLLRPTEDANALIGGVLARAVQLTGVHLHGFVFASNHLHLLVTAEGDTLSRFMQHLLGNLARKVGRLVGWTGAFWERRFSAETVLDDEAALARLRYILAHGVKEGLVSRVLEWPGVSCARLLLGTMSRFFRWFHWGSRWSGGALKSQGEDLLSDHWAEKIRLELAPLPAWRAFSEERRRGAVKQLIADIERNEGRNQVLGIRGVVSQDPHHRPLSPKRTPGILCHASLRSLRVAFLERYRSFRADYLLASEKYRGGDWSVSFPPRAFRPVVRSPSHGLARAKPFAHGLAVDANWRKTTRERPTSS